MKKIKRIITNKGRQIRFENVWLLYNFNFFKGFFWTKEQAWSEANDSSINKKDIKEIYQVLRGDIEITIHEDLFYKEPIKKEKKVKISYCDNCGNKIDWSKGGFQCGENKEKKIGTWCSEKCFKKYKLK